MAKLTAVIPIQQQKPIRIGLPPVFTSLIILVFKPMAHMDSTMKNLLRVLSGSKASTATPMFKATVVITEASTK